MTCLSTRLLSLALFAASALSMTSAQTAAPSKSASSSKTASQTPSTATAAKSSTTAAKPASDADKLDINTATADQLKALKGIGDAYSKRIIDGRPYTAKNQLTSKGIIPVGTYNGIKDQIIAHAPKK